MRKRGIRARSVCRGVDWRTAPDGPGRAGREISRPKRVLRVSRPRTEFRELTRRFWSEAVFQVVGTGVDPVTPRFSGACSTN
jgi:hypothetical protein